MLHDHTIWKIMRKYTNRQIQVDSVKETSILLENIIRNIVESSEKLLLYNGNKNQRITKDCIKAVIKLKYDSLLPEMAGGIKKEKESNMLQLPNEAT